MDFTPESAIIKHDIAFTWLFVPFPEWGFIWQSDGIAYTDVYLKICRKGMDRQ